MPGGANHEDVVKMDTTHGIGTFAGGQYFTLSFGGCPLCPSTSSATTGNIDWTQDTDGQTNTNSLQSRLNALSNIASSASDTGSLGVNVTRSNINNATNEGYVFSVTFSGSYVAGNVSLLSLQDNLLGGQSTSDGAITVTINELIAGYTPGFKLVYGSETTGCIAWDGLGKSDVVSVEARLEALSGITDISTVTKSSISSPENGFAYTIVFNNPSAPTSLSVPLQASVTDCDAMPGGANHEDVVKMDTTHGIGTFAGGQYFTLSFGGCPLCPSTSSATTGNIDWTQDTDGQTNTNSLQSRLNALTNIASSASDTGSLGVVVTRSNINNPTNEGYVFSVTFSGSYVAGNVSLLSLQDNFLGGQSTSDGAITVTINELIAGYTPGFKLVYGSETTGCIAWDGLGKSDVVSVEARLEALSGITDILHCYKIIYFES